MITHMNGWDIVDLDFPKVFYNVLTEERFYLKGKQASAELRRAELLKHD